MRCFCCSEEMAKARKVKIRRCAPCPSASLGPYSAVWTAYQKQMTYRWNVICPTCYDVLDNIWGAAEIAGNEFNLAGNSRRNRARWLTKEQYDAWQLKDAKKGTPNMVTMGWIQPMPKLPAYIREEPDPARKQALFDELLAGSCREIALEQQNIAIKDQVADEPK